MGNRWKWKLGAIAIVVIAFELFAHRVLAQGAAGAATSTLATIGRAAVILAVLWLLYRGVKGGRLKLPLPHRRSPAQRLADRLASAENSADAVREYVAKRGAEPSSASPPAAASSRPTPSTP